MKNQAISNKSVTITKWTNTNKRSKKFRNLNLGEVDIHKQIKI